MSSDRVQRALTIAVVAMLVLVLALSQLLPKGGEDRRPGSVASNEPRGRRALFLVLQELGFAPEAWKRNPGALPAGEHVLWTSDAPGELASDEPSPRRRDLDPGVFDVHAHEHYRRFVEGGGTLIVPWRARTLAFLVDELEVEELAGFEAPEEAPSGERRARAVTIEDGSEIAVEWPDDARLPDALAFAVASASWTSSRDDGGRDLLAALVPLGGGRIVLLADDSFADNERLGRASHGELAVRLVESARAGRVLFDEYALGSWEPESALAVAFSEALAPVSWHTLLLLALFVWMHAWARTFPRDPRALEQLSPLSRARAQANVLERAGRFGQLASFLRRGELKRLARAARLARTQEPADVDAVQRELDLVAERASAADELPRWRELWLQRPVKDAAALEELARGLDAAIARAGSTRRAR